MTKILGVDTSTVAASVAVIDDGKLMGESYTSYKLKHSEKLLPMIDHLLEDLRLKISDIDYFAIGSGPGSFTGLRIAASTIKGFAHVTGKSIISVSSLDACAYPLRNMTGCVAVMFDAQKSDVYFGLYKKNSKGIFKAQDEDKIVNTGELPFLLKDCDSFVVTGDGVEKNKPFLVEEFKDKIIFADDYFQFPRASSVAYIANSYIKNNANMYTYENYLPNYIRVSAAEENLKK